jgi:hypothetical protein
MCSIYEKWRPTRYLQPLRLMFKPLIPAADTNDRYDDLSDSAPVKSVLYALYRASRLESFGRQRDNHLLHQLLHFQV